MESDEDAHDDLDDTRDDDDDVSEDDEHNDGEDDDEDDEVDAGGMMHMEDFNNLDDDDHHDNDDDDEDDASYDEEEDENVEEQYDEDGEDNDIDDDVGDYTNNDDVGDGTNMMMNTDAEDRLDEDDLADNLDIDEREETLMTDSDFLSTYEDARSAHRYGGSRLIDEENDAAILNETGDSAMDLALDGVEDFEGDYIDQDDADNDNATHNEDAEDDEEIDGTVEGRNNENYWMRMGSSAAGTSRHLTSGSSRHPAVRDFFLRTRSHHDRSGRSRASSSGGGGGGGGISGSFVSRNPFSDVAEFMNNLAGHALQQNPGAGLVFSTSSSSSSGLPTTNTQGRVGGIDGIHIDGSLSGLDLSSQRFVFQSSAGNDETGNSGADLSSSFRQFISNYLPANMSSSTARFDHRTGAVTLSFGRTRDFSGNSSTHAPMTSNNRLVQPHLHPLLSVTDARRNRFLLPNANGAQNASTTAFNAVSSNCGMPLRTAALVRETTTSNHIVDSTNRLARNAVSVRRRSIGPIVSDRRWGTDMGDLEPAGSRLIALTTAMEVALKDSIEKESSDVASRLTALQRAASVAAAGGGLGDGPRRSYRDLYGFGGFSDMHPMEDMISPPALGGDRYTSDFSEPEGSEEEEQEGQQQQQQLVVPNHPFVEESKEEGELQESKDGDIMGDLLLPVLNLDPIRNNNNNNNNQTNSNNNNNSNNADLVATVSEFPFSEPYDPMLDSAVLMNDLHSLFHPLIATADSTSSNAMNDVVQSSVGPNPVVSSSADSAPVVALATTDNDDALEQVLYTRNVAPIEAQIEAQIDAEMTSDVVREDNLRFLNSLPYELRVDVLTTAEDALLHVLPLHIQQEAHQLREQQALQIQLRNYNDPHQHHLSSSSTMTLPFISNDFPTAALSSNVTSLDIASIMDDIRQLRENMNTAEALETTQQQQQQQQPPVINTAAAPVGGENSSSSSSGTSLEPTDRRIAPVVQSLAPIPMDVMPPTITIAPTTHSEVTAVTSSSSSSSSLIIAANEVSHPSSSSSSGNLQSVENGMSGATTAAAAAAVGDVLSSKISSTISIAEDRISPVLPYNTQLICHLLMCFFSTNKSKLPRAILKLLATACRYRQGRPFILQALFASLTHNNHRIIQNMRRLPPSIEHQEPETTATTTIATSSLDRCFAQLEETVEATRQNPLHLRRILYGISFLLRKTDRLVWYSTMLRPPSLSDNSNDVDCDDDHNDDGQVWLFGSLLELLDDPVNASSLNLEFLLHVIEEFCVPISKLTAIQANELALSFLSKLPIGHRLLQALYPSFTSTTATTSSSTTQRLETVVEEVDETVTSPHANKKRRIDDAMIAVVSVPATATSISSSNTPAVGPSVAMITTGPSSIGSDDKNALMPFPILEENEIRILCDVAGSVNCGGLSRKRLMKIMRILSLYDGNWISALQQLSVVGADLASKATIEFCNLHSTIVNVLQNQQTATAALSKPELSTPRSLSEVRLLNVLRLMTVLRARGSTAAIVEVDVVAAYMRKIQVGKLWEVLFECLDIVRDLEGITDYAIEEDDDESINNGSSSSSSSSSKRGVNDKEPETKVTLSALTMRFMPLIECFLTVCSTTVLVRPKLNNDNSCDSSNSTTNKDSVTTTVGGGSSSSSSSSSIKRKSDQHDEASSLAPPPAAVSTPSTHSRYPFPSPSPLTIGGGGHPMTRVNSMLPGSRFRQSPSYFQMQMELSDEVASERLLTFTRKNRVLFNQVLRNNIQLLETSFSPLVNVPKCRQLLHFDIKRAYFKMRLKRMRQSTSSRMHGSLRLSVRRARVFEESFQALRYKTADEMRRRVSISFHGEEGMDAGGLTREWYSVLARDIFNADYALFVSSGDSVTFQPNAYSFVNEDHLLYFKFVGRVIGKAICDGQLLDAHFTRSFYKHILGVPVSVLDLEAIEPDYYKSLQQILSTPLDLLGLDLSFSAESNEFGHVSIVDLIPNGRDIPVNEENKSEYVKLLAHHRMTTAIRKQVCH